MPHDILIRSLILPVLAAQAVQVVRRAARLPEADGARMGETGEGPPLRLLIAGDSSAAGVGVERQEQALSGQLVAALGRSRRVAWRLEAESGATTRTTIARLGALPEQRFDVAVLALGVNDVTRAVPAALWRSRQRRLARLLRDRFGVARIHASAVPPLHLFPLIPEPLRWVLGAQARRFDRQLVALAATEPGLVHVRPDLAPGPEDFAADGFHPGAGLYRVWAERLARSILTAEDRGPPGGR